ncbi:hypothetical protein E2C01_023089 [Portunus trituberculatus]|uniref:Uncharacterized protein n=1 Tax=Portunus trituberculatus TaxID=210409 RepID=A0A5B7E7W8_PORTR|nr:hypothetical protein [Portunus trituberculatus]
MTPSLDHRNSPAQTKCLLFLPQGVTSSASHLLLVGPDGEEWICWRQFEVYDTLRSCLASYFIYDVISHDHTSSRSFPSFSLPCVT